MTLGALFSLPALGQAVLDRRARNAIRISPLDQRSVEKLAQTLRQADVFGIKLPSSTIAAVQATLREASAASPHLLGEAIKAASAAASNSTIDIGLPPDFQGEVFERLPEAKGSKWQFFPIATNTGPDSYAHIGITREPNVARMEPLNRPGVPLDAYGPAFFVAKGMKAALDGWHLKHIVFQDMSLSYHGGPLLLESVFFFNCKLECVPTENSWSLIAAVSKGGWVSLSLN